MVRIAQTAFTDWRSLRWENRIMWDWMPNMEQHIAEEDDRRAVARRLFRALCAQYPHRYIALIQPHDAASARLPAPAFTAVEAQATP